MGDELRNRKDAKVNDFGIKDPRLLEKEMNVMVPTYPYKSSSEYAAAVNQWLWQCYNWQCMTLTFPYLVTQTAACRAQVSNSSSTMDFNRNFTSTYFPNQNLFVNQTRQPDGSLRARGVGATDDDSGSDPFQDFMIPSFLKRAAAETIDFCILLVLKLVITYIAIDFFDFVNFDKYHLDFVQNDKLDYQKAVEATSGIVALEVAHRIIVCLVEALCISKGIFSKGATPGKALMRLRVVSVYRIVRIDSNVVRIYPAGDLDICGSLVRAFTKNFSMAVIFPAFFMMYFFQYNRTMYDIMCSCIVVEEMPTNHHHNRQQ